MVREVTRCPGRWPICSGPGLPTTGSACAAATPLGPGARWCASARARAAWMATRPRPAARPPHFGVLLDNVPELVFLLGGAALSGNVVVARLSPKWTPRYVRVTARLPITASNKVLRRRLAAEAWHTGDPIWWRPGRDVRYVPWTGADLGRLRAEFDRRGRQHLWPVWSGVMAGARRRAKGRRGSGRRTAPRRAEGERCDPCRRGGRRRREVRRRPWTSSWTKTHVT